MATRPRGLSLGELAFFSIWLLGWTLGVAVIQSLTLEGGPFSPTAIFMITHGGAEVLVLSVLARRIRAAAKMATVPPVLTRDHAGLTASWPMGTGSLALAVGSAVLGAVAHLVLMSVPLFAMADPTWWSVSLGVVLLAVWSYTGVRWAQAVGTHFEAREQVDLKADFDAVTVRQGGATATLPMVGLEVQDGGKGELTLASGEASWSGRLATSPARAELVEALRVMAERAVPAESVEQPEALRRLRGESQAT